MNARACPDEAGCLTCTTVNIYIVCSGAHAHSRPISLFLFVQVDVKIMLGLAGVLIVLASVTSSIGLMALVRFPMTLIIVEVLVPALYLLHVVLLILYCTCTILVLYSTCTVF